MLKGVCTYSAVPFVVCVVCCVAPALAAQPSDELQQAFEVASIRPTAFKAAGGEGGTRSQIQAAPDGLVLGNINMDEMIEWAYNLQHGQLANPGFLRDHRFDIRARAGRPVTERTLRIMLQNLLASRFNLAIHKEQKLTSVYELVTAKNGPTLPPNKADKLPASYSRETYPRVVDGDFVFTNTSMPEFAQQLTELRGIDLPVIDRTGIQGVYDITLKSAAIAMRDSSGPSLLTLIHEQLGLKLVGAKARIEVMVIDHADEPSAN